MNDQALPPQSEPVDGPTAEYRPQVQAETLALLFRQSTPAMFFALAIAVLVAIALWPAVERAALSAWLGMVLLSFLSRAALFAAYRLRRPQGEDVLRWRTPYIASLMFAGAVWGFGLLWLMPADSVLHQMVAYVFLIGMASAALTTYSAVREIAVATCVVTLLPTVVWLLFQGDALRLTMGLAGLLFMVSAWRATRILSRAMYRSIQLTRALDVARASAEQAAQLDDLTGLFNRRALIERGNELIEQCRRRGQPISAVILDLDHFKSINDSFGHAAGDRALEQMAVVMRQCLRDRDLCGRLGGEEFAVLMPGTRLADALAIAERIRTAIAAHLVVTEQGTRPITASSGVASNVYDLDQLLILADEAMYRAKELGRNRTVSAHQPGITAEAVPLPEQEDRSQAQCQQHQ